MAKRMQIDVGPPTEGDVSEIEVGGAGQMRVDVSDDYNAWATVQSLRVTVHAHQDVVRDRVAEECASRLRLAPESLTFNVYESFNGGPARETLGWRFRRSSSAEEILESMLTGDEVPQL